MDYSFIQVTRQVNDFGVVEMNNYKWVGTSPFVNLSYDLRFDFDLGARVIKIGPYRLRFVSWTPHTGTYLYVKDSPHGRLLEFGYKSTRWLDLVYRRVLMTLVVWRLADYEPHRLQTWQDVKFLKWLIKK